MKKLLVLLFIGSCPLVFHSCSEESYPVPPASTVPKFSFVIDNEEFAPATVTFNNESIIPARAGEVSYAWSFGDGTSSADANPTHLYEAPGAYDVTLVIVTSGSAEIQEETTTLVIKDPNATGTPAYFTDGSEIFTGLLNSQAPIMTSLGTPALNDGYSMVIDTVTDKLYISDLGADKIYISDLDGGNFGEFRTAAGDPTALAIDYETSELYWATGDGVRKADLTDNTPGQYDDVVTGQANDPDGIAIAGEGANKTLYWNNYDGGVWMKDIGGAGNEQEIIPGGQGGGSIIVVGNRIFFDEWMAADDSYLKSANLDGSGIAIVATGIKDVVYALAYDPESNKIYWGDRTPGVIVRADLDGTNPEVWYAKTGSSPRGLVFGKKK